MFTDVLHDRFVCGMNHEATQCKLLIEKNLTFDKALDIASTIEAAEINVKTLSKQTTTSTFLRLVTGVNFT